MRSDAKALRRALGIIVALALPMVPTGVWAQEEEYTQEIGLMLGSSFYLGDANSTPLSHPSIVAGAVWRKLFNQRMALKANLGMGHLRGTSEGYVIPTDAYDPEGGELTVVSFKRNVVDAGAQFEFNFLGYGLGEEYKGNHRWTPYLLAGMGLTLATGGGGGTCAAANFPLGAGVKYKLGPRWNAGLEWTFRFTTSDRLDVNAGQTSLSHPLGVKSIGLKNKDAYSFLALQLTYDIAPKCKECHNNK